MSKSQIVVTVCAPPLWPPPPPTPRAPPAGIILCQSVNEYFTEPFGISENKVVLRYQLGALQFNSTLTPSTWRQLQIPQLADKGWSGKPSLIRWSEGLSPTRFPPQPSASDMPAIAPAIICASGPLATDRRVPWPLLVLDLVTRAAYRTQRNISLGRSPVYCERMWLKNSTGQRTGKGCRSFHTLSLHRPGGTHNLVLLGFYGALITEGYSSWSHKELDMTEHTHTHTHTHTYKHTHAHTHNIHLID